MSQQASFSAGKFYGLERVTRIRGVLGAISYRHRQEPVARERPGPLGAMSDQELIGEIRQLLQASLLIRRKISGLEETKKPRGPCRCTAYMTRPQRDDRPASARVAHAPGSRRRLPAAVGHCPGQRRRKALSVDASG
jgi:hypothetical protein